MERVIRESGLEAHYLALSKAGKSEADLERLARTRFGIEQRLVKLGRLPAAPGGGRFGGAPTGGLRMVQAAQPGA